MTTNKSIKAIKDYLRYSNVSESQYNEIIFQDDEATLNGKALFNFGYDNGAMDLLTLDYDFICGLNMDELVELFHDLYYKVNCDSCENTGKTIASHNPYETEFADCECSNVEFKN